MEPLPTLPTSFKLRNNYEALRLVAPIAVGYGICVLTSMTIFDWMLRTATWWSYAASLPILFTCSLVAGFYLIECAVLSHDGGHGFLHRNLKVSFFLGILISSLCPFYMGISYNEGHWPHHKFCNTEKDPQALWSSSHRLNSWPRAVALLGLSVQTHLHYLKRALAYARGLAVVPSLTPLWSKRFARLNMLLNATFTVGWISLGITHPSTFVLCFVLPWIFGLLWFSGLSYVEHGDTELGYRNSRSLSHPVFDILMTGDNYHLEHHLYPWVQRSKLRRLHTHLKSIGFHERNSCIVDGEFLSIFTTMFTSKHPVFLNRENIDWMPEDSHLEKKSA